jgi:hypothetical protein
VSIQVARPLEVVLKGEVVKFDVACGEDTPSPGAGPQSLAQSSFALGNLPRHLSPHLISSHPIVISFLTSLPRTPQSVFVVSQNRTLKQGIRALP